MGKRKKRNVRPQQEIPASPSAPRNDSEVRKKNKGGKPDFEVRIRISKRPKVDHYSGDIEATNATALIEALAVLIQKAAGIIGAPTERVYAVIATLLFKERESEEDDTTEIAPQAFPTVTTPACELVRNDMEA